MLEEKFMFCLRTSVIVDSRTDGHRENLVGNHIPELDEEQRMCYGRKNAKSAAACRNLS